MKITTTNLESTSADQRRMIQFLGLDKRRLNLFTSREAAWSCRSVGPKKETYGFWLIVASLFVFFLTFLKIMRMFIGFNKILNKLDVFN